MMMRFLRTITAFVVALSVAMLPVPGSASIVVQPTEQAAFVEKAPGAQKAPGAEMSAAMDFCQDDVNPCGRSADQCPSMASCPFQFVGLTNISMPGLRHILLPASLLPMLADKVLSPHDGSPPFRPPRV